MVLEFIIAALFIILFISELLVNVDNWASSTSMSGTQLLIFSISKYFLYMIAVIFLCISIGDLENYKIKDQYLEDKISYNEGKCSKCDGNFEYKCRDFDEHKYIYECKNCGKVIELWSYK